MTGLETAIRNALARAGDDDPQARDRVYRSARAAFEKSIAQHEAERAIEPDAAALQRRRFEDIVATIEAGYDHADDDAAAGPEVPAAERPLTPADFLALVPERADARARRPVQPAPRIEAATAGAQPDTAAAPSVSARSEPAGAPSVTPAARIAAEGSRPVAVAPAVSLDPRSSERVATGRAEPSLDVTRSPEDLADDRVDRFGTAERLVPDAAPTVAKPRTVEGRVSRRERKRAEKAERRRRGGALAAFLGFVILVGAAGGALYWAAQNGILEDMARNVANRAASSGGASAPRLTADDEFSGNWLSAFEPSAAADIKPGTAASVEAVDIEHGAAARIASRSGRADGEVRVPVSADILAALAGKRGTIALTLRATGDADTQIYVECSFGSLGACGRRRFIAQNQLGNTIFEVDFTKAAADGNAGFLILNADIFGKGGSIDLFAVRILPEA